MHAPIIPLLEEYIKNYLLGVKCVLTHGREITQVLGVKLCLCLDYDFIKIRHPISSLYEYNLALKSFIF